ncbi:Coiled-coil domain-containing protein [Fasciolopsis buskii]|uniref:Coiled-coil domain-containing protein n=1 Tax=Fasciolopsis buskii TaxID=27845 RepID=A0A8E0RUK1_9TREM|nr:Coiled-coil domain-containing protein [Fasciolopsis buski]
MRVETSNLKEIPNIDLHNFDDICFLGSRYVLTSPRSLQACANLNIKPVDLLPKNRWNFEKEHRNFGAKKIESLFAYCEEDRRDKLFKARLERMRLVRQENHLPLNQFHEKDSCEEVFHNFAP